MGERLCKTAHFWARQLGESDKTVRRALEEIPPDGDRGETQPTYYLATVFRALTQLDQELDANRERARKDKEAADKLAMENAVTRGDLARVSVMAREVGQLLADHRQNALALPTKLAPLLKGLDEDRIRLRLEDAVYELLGDLADYRPGRGAGSDTQGAADSDEGREAPATAAPEPVGRRAKAPKSGK